MASIANITARQIFDSRGIPTVEVTVELNTGVTATSSSPSGYIANELEAQELRDGNSAEFFGLGVRNAVNNVNTVIREALVGKDPLYQTQIDQILVNLDGTTNKSKLGANAILATSQAVMKAAATSLKLPLFVYIKEKYQLIQSYRVPTPIFNLINGGAHGSGTLDFQEFQLVPASHLNYSKALQIGVEMFMALEKVLEQKGAIRAVGVEGGYSPNLATNTDALEIFSEAIKLTPYALAKDAFLGLDVAPRNFYRNSKYTIKDRPQPMKARELVQFYKDLHHQYRVFSFEDPLMPDTWSDWKFMTAEMGQTAMIVADDLISTNKTLLMKAIQEGACNAVVIKPNRIGTVTEAIEITHLARENGWHTIMSHRSGETTDDFIADLAVGIGTEYVKFGAPSRGERVVKYNRLLRIEEILLRSRKSDSPTDTQSAGPTNTTEGNPMNMSNDNGSNVSPLDGSASASTPPTNDTPTTSSPGQTAPTPTVTTDQTPSMPPAPAAPQGTSQATNMAAAGTPQPAVAPTPTPQQNPAENTAPGMAAPQPTSNPLATPSAATTPKPGPTLDTTPAPDGAASLQPASQVPPTNVQATAPAPTSPTPDALGSMPPTAPVGTESGAPAAPANLAAPESAGNDVNDLQNSINELANMVATPGAAPEPQPTTTQPTAAPATPTPAPTPTAPAAASPVTATPTTPQPGVQSPAEQPAQANGLTPPTPPQQ